MHPSSRVAAALASVARRAAAPAVLAARRAAPPSPRLAAAPRRAAPCRRGGGALARARGGRAGGGRARPRAAAAQPPPAGARPPLAVACRRCGCGTTSPRRACRPRPAACRRRKLPMRLLFSASCAELPPPPPVSHPPTPPHCASSIPCVLSLLFPCTSRHSHHPSAHPPPLYFAAVTTSARPLLPFPPPRSHLLPLPHHGSPPSRHWAGLPPLARSVHGHFPKTHGQPAGRLAGRARRTGMCAVGIPDGLGGCEGEGRGLRAATGGGRCRGTPRAPPFGVLAEAAVAAGGDGHGCGWRRPWLRVETAVAANASRPALSVRAVRVTAAASFALVCVIAAPLTYVCLWRLAVAALVEPPPVPALAVVFPLPPHPPPPIVLPSPAHSTNSSEPTALKPPPPTRWPFPRPPSAATSSLPPTRRAASVSLTPVAPTTRLGGT